MPGWLSARRCDFPNFSLILRGLSSNDLKPPPATVPWLPFLFLETALSSAARKPPPPTARSQTPDGPFTEERNRVTRHSDPQAPPANDRRLFSKSPASRSGTPMTRPDVCVVESAFLRRQAQRARGHCPVLPRKGS